MAGLTTDTDISQANETYVDGCCYAAAAALLLYEYVITLGEESRYIWRDVRTGYATLFMVNRWNMICMSIVMVGSAISVHDIVGCKAIQIFYVLVVLNIYLTWAAVSTLRVYAISRSVCLAIITGVLSFAPVVENIAGAAKDAVYIGQVGASNSCYVISSLSPRLYTTLLIFSRAALMTSDVLVLITTWRQLVGTIHSSIPRQTRTRFTLASLVLRDGTVYFVLFLILNAAQLIVCFMLERFDPVIICTLPMTCIVISRLTLNIRRFAYKRHELSIPEASRLEPHHHQASLLSVAVYRVDSHLSIDDPGAFSDSEDSTWPTLPDALEPVS